MTYPAGYELHPELKSDRLLIRRICKDDADLIYALRNVKDTALILDWPCYTDVKQAYNYIRTRCESIDRGECFYWVTVLESTGEPVGTICLWNLRGRTAEIGYELLPTYQGIGLMSEAVGAVLKFAFGDGDFEMIEALPYSINPKSLTLLERLGFKLDSTYEITHSNEEAVGLRYIKTINSYGQKK